MVTDSVACRKDNRPHLNEVMADRFRNLQFAGASARFIESCAEKSISQQLKERRISAVKVMPLLFSAGLGIGEDNNFYIGLNDTNTKDEDFESLGHEMGHTFHFNITQLVPLDVLPKCHYDQIEDFCTVFSSLWAERVNREEVARFLGKIRKF